jgi:nucleoside-diphosphate-sugar epimerase
MKNILLTWSTWFVWSHLLIALINKWFNVFAVVRKWSNISRIDECLLNKNLQIIYVTEHDDVEKIFLKHKINFIIHLATTYKKTHNKLDIDEMINTNITFWTYLCDLSVKYGVKYFINTWTFFEYAHYKNKKNIITEKTQERAYNLYASTKIAFNNIIKYYTENYDFKSVTLRLFSPYWPNDNDKIIPLIIKNTIDDNNVLNLSWWKQKLSFTYIDDIVDAYLLSLNYIIKTRNKFSIFNIWSSQVVSLKEIYKNILKISKKSGKNINFWIVPYSKNDIFYSWCDNSKAKDELWWTTKYWIKDWLSLTYKSYLNEVYRN